jgi:hypothetical protein
MHDASWWISILSAPVSLIVSVIALILSLRAQREANAVQRKLVEIEEKREQERQLGLRQASLQPEIRASGIGFHRLYIANHGAAEARNVRVSLDGKPLEQHRVAVRGSPIPSLVGPGNEVSCLLAISHECPPPFQCEIRWDDDSGQGRFYRTTLTF